MTGDQITSLQNELHQFVLQTQNRLAGLQKALINLKEKEAAKESVREAVPLGEEMDLGAPTEQVETMKQNELGSAAEPFLPGRSSPTEGKNPENRPADATAPDWLAMDESSDASERLEAIKRRLAEQIENA